MKKTTSIASDILLIALGLFCLAPLIYMVVMSFNSTYSSFDFRLDNLTLEHYVAIFQNPKLLRYLLNSVIYAVGGVSLTLLFSSLAGYAFAKLNFKGNHLIFLLVIMTMIIPVEVILVPRYIIMKNLHWLNTFRALILPVPGAFGVFVMRQAIMGIPKELLESARIDGCSDFKILWKIVLPLVKSALIMLTIFTFMMTWNNFLWPLIVSTKEAMRTFPLGLSTMKAQYDNNVGSLMASATVSFLPPFVLYIILQKRFVEGVSLTGMKG